jgi:small subunit ribosomal protein S5
LSEATPEKKDEQNAQDASEVQAVETPVEASPETPADASTEASEAAPAEGGDAAEATEAPAEQEPEAEPAFKRGARSHQPAARERRGRRSRRDEPEADRRDDHYENVVKVFRTAAVVKGGRRFSFAALTVVGDRNGRVGIGYGKANGVPNAVEKSFKQARRSMHKVTLAGHTLPHEVTGRYLASRVFMRPAAPGTGIIAGAAVRAVVEAAGVRDVLTKAYGSTASKNLVKATLQGLQALRDRAAVARLRGVELE